MQDVIAKFAELLSIRLASGVATTEDSVRYTFFAALVDHGFGPYDIILEYPHPSLPRAKIDTWIQVPESAPTAIEFKYDRDPPGGRNQPKTQKAGKVFHDLARLSVVSSKLESRCIFVYLTTREMAVYFDNPSNGHRDWYTLEAGAVIEVGDSYFAGKPATFLRELGDPFTATVQCLLSTSLPDAHVLRAYQVDAE